MIKTKLILIKNKFGYYDPPSFPSEDLSLEMVSLIFIEGGSVNYIKEDLLNESMKGVSGNQFYIFMEGGDKLLIGDQFDDNDKYEVEFSKKVLLKLLDQWTDLVAKSTQEIVFYRNGDEYGMVDAQDFHEA